MKKTSILIILLVIGLLMVRKQEIKDSKVKVPESVSIRYLNISNLYTTLHFPANWNKNPKFIKIRRWFETEPELQMLKLESKFNVYEEGTDFFNERYAGRVTVPSILIQNPDGSIIFSATGNNIPKTSKELISKINLKVPHTVQKGWKNMYREKKRHDSNCDTPKVTPRLEPVFDISSKKEEKESYLNLLLALAAGAATGVYSKTKSEEN